MDSNYNLANPLDASPKARLCLTHEGKSPITQEQKENDGKYSTRYATYS